VLCLIDVQLKLTVAWVYLQYARFVLLKTDDSLLGLPRSVYFESTVGCLKAADVCEIDVPLARWRIDDYWLTFELKSIACGTVCESPTKTKPNQWHWCKGNLSAESRVLCRIVSAVGYAIRAIHRLSIKMS
jgi:hypothetical protein